MREFMLLLMMTAMAIGIAIAGLAYAPMAHTAGIRMGSSPGLPVTGPAPGNPA